MANPVFTTHYSEITDTTFVESSNTGEIAAIESILLSSPGANERFSARNITIFNSDALPKTVVVAIKDGSEYVRVCQTSLEENDTLIIDQLINLNETTESLVGILLSYAGYFAGGNSGAAVTTTDKLVYSTLTTSAQSSANLGTATEAARGVENLTIAGYIAGGFTSATTNVAYKLTYSNDTTATQSSANLSQARYALAGVTDIGVAGYFAGGNSGARVVTADKLTYSNDTTAAQSSANLSQARELLVGTNNYETSGYFVGGSTGAVVATADKLTYSNDTTAAQSSANLTAARTGIAESANTLFGYFQGGSTTTSSAGIVASTDKLVFATDTTSAQASANISQARFLLTGVGNTHNRGFIAGGTIGSVVATTDELDYETETSFAVVSTNLSQARYTTAGLDG